MLTVHTPRSRNLICLLKRPGEGLGEQEAGLSLLAFACLFCILCSVLRCTFQKVNKI